MDKTIGVKKQLWSKNAAGKQSFAIKDITQNDLYNFYIATTLKEELCCVIMIFKNIFNMAIGNNAHAARILMY